MQLLTRNEAFEAICKGQVIGILGCRDVSIFFYHGVYYFKAQDNTLERLDMRTMAQDDGYFLVERSNARLAKFTKTWRVL